MIDLHTHTNLSDGTLTPAELVREAGRRGLRVLALTDHDTLDGLPEAAAEAATIGIDFVPGVELSTDVGRHEVHILGYYVDERDPDLRAALATLERQRLARIERIVDRLGQIGRPVDLARVIELAGPGTVGRPHVARAMIERGYVGSVSDAFDRFLAAGRPGFVPRSRVEPESAVAMVLAGGGVPVLAHPLTTGDPEAMVARLVRAGLRGIEVYYGEYEPPARLALRALADAWDLVPTGGSDYHGEGFKEGRGLGSVAVPAECVDRLRAAATAIRTANQDQRLPA